MRNGHPNRCQRWGPSGLPNLIFACPYLCPAPPLRDPATTDTFLRGGFRPDYRLPFLPREHLPITITVQDHPGQGSTTCQILLRPQDRTHIVEDPQPKALTVVSLTYRVGLGDLSPPRFPAVVRLLVHAHPVHINTLHALSGAGPSGYCPHERPQPPRGPAHPLPVA